MKKFLIAFFALILFVVSGKSASALEFRSGETIDISEIASVSGSLVATGRTITIDGTVNGDLFCAGQNVTIRGDVDGDIICAAQTITLWGKVNGDVRVASQNVHFISAQVARNVTAFAQDITLDDTTAVRGEVYVNAQRFELGGIVGGGISGNTQDARISGGVIGNVQLDVESLTLANKATISGSLVYKSDKTAQIANSATVSGSITQDKPKVVEKTQVTKMQPQFSLFGFLSRALIYSLLGIVLLRFFPRFSARMVANIENQTGKGLGFGILGLFAVPVILVLLAITIIGIPIALFGLFLWLSVLFLSRIFVVVVVGKYILNRFNSPKVRDEMWIVVVGVLVSTLAFKLPFVGVLFSFIALVLGFGAFLLTLPWFNKNQKSVKKLAN